MKLISRIAGDCRRDRGGDEAEGRGEAVSGRGRGDPDDDAGDEADRVLLQALVFNPCRGLCGRTGNCGALQRSASMALAGRRRLSATVSPGGPRRKWQMSQKHTSPLYLMYKSAVLLS